MAIQRELVLSMQKARSCADKARLSDIPHLYPSVCRDRKQGLYRCSESKQ